MILAMLPNGLEVMWDGKNKLQIFANSSLFGKTTVRKFYDQNRKIYVK